MSRVLLGVVAWLWLTSSGALAGPILSTGPYNVVLPGGADYTISGQVSLGGVGYIYSYSVTNNTNEARNFELGIAESQDLYGMYTEQNPSVSPGAGLLLRDRNPHVTYGPGVHNYVWNSLVNGSRVGITVGAGQTQTMSFEDPHSPILNIWSLRERSPTSFVVTNTGLQMGGLPAPVGAPEPGSLTLAILGIGGLGASAVRRMRRQKSELAS